jgi:NTE family protein
MGVLKAIAELVPDKFNPFPVVVGTSVGAINAASLACHAHDFKAAAEQLAELWLDFMPATSIVLIL